MREKDQLDLLIDSALASYAEPLAGLEDRVLSVLAAARHEAPPKPRLAAFPLRRSMLWAVGLAVAACVLRVLIVHNIGRPREMQARNTLSLQPQRTATPIVSAATGPTHIARARNPMPGERHFRPVVPRAELPKLDIFPSTRPLTAEEQALVDFAGRAPEEERKAVAEAQQQIETPVGVAAIHIPPLDSPDKGQP